MTASTIRDRLNSFKELSVHFIVVMLIVLPNYYFDSFLHTCTSTYMDTRFVVPFSIMVRRARMLVGMERSSSFTVIPTIFFVYFIILKAI